MRSITVLLAVVPGVGEGAGFGVGLGAGKALVVVEDEDFPPQATRANVIASMRKQQ
jgi:hypothetical protein